MTGSPSKCSDTYLHVNHDNMVKTVDKTVDNATVALFFFTMAARKRSAPFKRFSVALEDGRLDRYVLSALNLTRMYVWQDDGELVMITFNINNLSNFKFNASQRYDIKADETSAAIHRRQAFSTSTLDQVIDDFSIVEDSDLWSMHNPATPYPLPPGLSDSISIIAACNSMQSESARRTIISLYLSYALHTVDPEAKFLTIAEEINIDVIKKVDYDGISETVQYKGPVDFLVGHSGNARSTAKRTHSDAALLVIEAKRRTTFEAALGQVIAQAASILCYRRNAARGRGAYRTYWAYSDGERWVFGYVRPEGAGTSVRVRKTDEMKGRLKPGFDKKGCELVFNHVVGLVSRAFRSTPRNSLVDLSETGDSSGDEDDGGEDDPDADPSLIDSVVDPLSSVRL
ncbi:hypothetical protein BDK51DRAFT_40580 [Blyttiomyces helicus]|uniref:Uncharacterized protein n=1 Tax=Blyttiomyces helicus TaxID=388810 RepID=A0A4P9WLC7_9FUNG|nr:hypothetical protein BDK51DRAFT_40580 [Blyttiomyces helicus]|eukprot:RKO93674.1 hypothetical protein BDK51DRAFT_40580 [Blyttiomyces helicus]